LLLLSVILSISRSRYFGTTTEKRLSTWSCNLKGLLLNKLMLVMLGWSGNPLLAKRFVDMLGKIRVTMNSKSVKRLRDKLKSSNPVK
jgi:hypothetical protein